MMRHQERDRLAERQFCGIIAAGITAVGAVAGGAIASKGASKASKAATQASENNNALQKEIYSSNKSVLDPYIKQGLQNTDKINAMLATNPYAYGPANLEQDPGYQFRLQQGLQAVTQSKAVNGLLKSGSALKALNDYAQGQASQEYNQGFNRHQAKTGSYLSALGNQQAAGVAAGSALAGVGTNYANATSANNNNAAQVQGNAALASANQTNNLIGQGINALGYAAGSGGFGGLGGARGSSYTPSNQFLPQGTLV